MLSKRMACLTPYTAGEQPQDKKYIKLNTNENPYPPTGGVKNYLREVDPADLRLYPDPKMIQLRTAIGKSNSVSPSRIFVGNGSDEVLSFVFYSLFDTVTFPEITYSFYPVYCDFYGIPYQTVLLDADYGIDLDALAKAAPMSPVIFANPNSPTGMYVEPERIEAFLRSRDARAAVVVDEAYIRFGGESCINLLDSFPNLVIVRTFSKSHSLAGLRLGYAIGSEEIVEALFTVKDSFNSYPVSRLGQELGIRALQDSDENGDVVAKIIANREWITSELSAMGWRVLPSYANFIFASMPNRDGAFVYSELKNRGILVRYFDKPGINNFVRITIGTREQMRSLVTAVKELE